MKTTVRVIDKQVEDAAYEMYLGERAEDTGALAEQMFSAVWNGVTEEGSIKQGVKDIASSRELGSSLTGLDTNRGGASGFKGFVNEPLVAHEEVLAGKNTKVLGNNGVADLETIGKNGHKYHTQLKVGYKTGKIDFEKYKGQTVAFDKGNERLETFVKQGKDAGVKVTETGVTESEAEDLAKAMRLETRITGQKTASIVPAAVEAKETIAAVHRAGVSSAKTGAQFGAGFSLGKNIVKVINDEKSVSEAVEDVMEDTAVSGVIGYAAGAARTAFASTSAGAAATEMLGSALASVGSTAAGEAVMAAVTTTTAAVGGLGTAAAGTVVGAVGTVVSTVGGAAMAVTSGTAIGGAVATGVGAATAGAAAVGAAAVAAAPVVVVGAVLGGIFSLFFD